MIIDLDGIGERERALLQAHIDAINDAYVKTIEEQSKKIALLDTFHKRSTWLVWLLFWISGFLVRGLFVDTHPEWSIASLIAGFAFGVCTYMALYSFLFGKNPR